MRSPTHTHTCKYNAINTGAERERDGEWESTLRLRYALVRLLRFINSLAQCALLLL